MWTVPTPDVAYLNLVPVCLNNQDPEERIIYGQENKRMKDGIEVPKGSTSVQVYIRIDTAISIEEKCEWELTFHLLGKFTSVYFTCCSNANYHKKKNKNKKN